MQKVVTKLMLKNRLNNLQKKQPLLIPKTLRLITIHTSSLEALSNPDAVVDWYLCIYCWWINRKLNLMLKIKEHERQRLIQTK